MGYLEEVGLLGVTHYDHAVDLTLQLDLLALLVVHEPLAYSSAALSILQ